MHFQIMVVFLRVQTFLLQRFSRTLVSLTVEAGGLIQTFYLSFIVLQNPLS